MQQAMTKILQSEATLMVFLRYLLVGAVILMGLARLRITLILLALSENFKERDILQIYLMAKGLVSGLNPYLPVDVLAEKFIGSFPYFPHPAPYPPINAILFIPLLALNFKNAMLAWYVFDVISLGAIPSMLVYLWRERFTWGGAIFMFFLLLAWFPFMADLEVGQLSVLLTLLLLDALLAFRKENRILP